MSQCKRTINAMHFLFNNLCTTVNLYNMYKLHNNPTIFRRDCRQTNLNQKTVSLCWKVFKMFKMVYVFNFQKLSCAKIVQTEIKKFFAIFENVKDEMLKIAYVFNFQELSCGIN